jgi:hypothetical protein
MSLFGPAAAVRDIPPRFRIWLLRLNTTMGATGTKSRNKGTCKMRFIILTATLIAPLAAHAGWFSPDVPDVGTQKWALCILNGMHTATTEDDVQYVKHFCEAYGKDHTPATAFIVPAVYSSGSECSQAMSRRLPLPLGDEGDEAEQVVAACFTLYNR